MTTSNPGSTLRTSITSINLTSTKTNRSGNRANRESTTKITKTITSLPFYPPLQYQLQPPILPARVPIIAPRVALNLRRALGRARQRLNPSPYLPLFITQRLAFLVQQARNRLNPPRRNPWNRQCRVIIYRLPVVPPLPPPILPNIAHVPVLAKPTFFFGKPEEDAEEWLQMFIDIVAANQWNDARKL